MDRAEELARAHWGYIESVLSKHDLTMHEIELAEFHYVSAFIHGYKHGEGDTQYPDEERPMRKLSRRPVRSTEMEDVPADSKGCCNE